MNEATEVIPHKRTPINLTLKQQRNFWRRVDASGGSDACWPWLSSTSKSGYGRYVGGSDELRAHRVAYSLTYGPIPHHDYGMAICVCHRCDNRICCNPSHLFLGTNADNTSDMIKKGRMNPPSGDRHHARRRPDKLARGERHGGTRLKWADVNFIRSLHASGGITHDELALMFNVCRPAITNILNHKTWKVEHSHL